MSKSGDGSVASGGDLTAEQADPEQLRVLLDLVFGYMPSRVVHLAAHLGIADQLGDGPRTSDELASATGMHSAALYRLLRALACLGIVEEYESRSFRLTELGALLRSDHPGSVRHLSLYFGRDATWLLWSQLHDRIRTGQSLLQSMGQQDPYAVLAGDPDYMEVFNGAMSQGSRLTAPGLVSAYDFSRFHTVVDVGGGTGTLLAAVLQSAPSLQGVLFDLPAGLEQASEHLEAAGVADRCRIVSGDFFDSVPEGGDAYLMKYIMHNWDDERAVVVLGNCRRVMPSGGRLIVVERVLPQVVEATPELVWALTIGDLSQLVQTGGRERTEAEFGELFEAADFNLTTVIPLGPPFNLSLIEAVPV